MEFWHGFAVLTVVHLLAAASPGPDFAYVTRQSLVHGRRAGLLASLGIALGLSDPHRVLGRRARGGASRIPRSWMTADQAARRRRTSCISGIAGLRSGKWRARDAAPGAAAVARRLGLAPGRRRLTLQRVQSEGAYLLPGAVHRGVVAWPAGADAGRLRRLDHAAAVLWFSLVALGVRASACATGCSPARHWIDRAFGAAMVGARHTRTRDRARLSRGRSRVARPSQLLAPSRRCRLTSRAPLAAALLGACSRPPEPSERVIHEERALAKRTRPGPASYAKRGEETFSPQNVRASRRTRRRSENGVWIVRGTLPADPTQTDAVRALRADDGVDDRARSTEPGQIFRRRPCRAAAPPAR